MRSVLLRSKEPNPHIGPSQYSLYWLLRSLAATCSCAFQQPEPCIDKCYVRIETLLFLRTLPSGCTPQPILPSPSNSSLSNPPEDITLWVHPSSSSKSSQLTSPFLPAPLSNRRVPSFNFSFSLFPF